MNKKNRITIVLVIILIASFVIYFSNGKVTEIKTEIETETNSQFTEGKNVLNNGANVKENEYYIVYAQSNNGVGSSFVPPSLNPGFKNNTGFNVSIIIDDYGNIVNDDKIIFVDNYIISKENEKKIREIAGEENYDAAIKEIKEGLNVAKNSIQSQGIASFNESSLEVKSNKYYFVYIKPNKGDVGVSFIPLKLNPEYSKSENYIPNINFKENGNISKDEKMILIENYVLTNEIREKVKIIAGSENYDAAIKEIEERIEEVK